MSEVCVASFATLEEALPVRVTPEGFKKSLVLVRLGEKVYVLDDMCTHAEASLSEGECYEEDLEIECPLHGATFDLSTGEATCLPATAAVQAYKVFLREDEVCIEIPGE